MRLSCLQENLSRGLGFVASAVPARTTYPVMQNVLIATDNARLKLSATNQEIAISTWIGAQIDEEGTVTVPARLLTEFTNSLPAERVDLRYTEQPVGMSVQCARFSAQINGAPANEFPPIPTVDSGVAGRVDTKVLTDAIRHVGIAAATEDSRPVLTGVKVEITGDKFTFAAADGFRLGVYNGRLIEPLSQDVEFIIPAKALSEVSRLAGNQPDPVEFTVTDPPSQALFRLNNIEVVANLLQGTFPNYAQLVPTQFENRTVVYLEEFIRATRAASIFARDGSGIVRLMINAASDAPNDAGDDAASDAGDDAASDAGDDAASDATDDAASDAADDAASDAVNKESGKMLVLSRAEEVGENQGEIDAKIEGGEAKIAFSSRYLTEVLNVLETNQVALETNSPSSPGVIRPVGDDKYVHVVMPIFVQW